MKTKGINKKQSQEKISELGLLTTPERLVWWMESCEVSVGRKKKKLWHGRGVWKEETHRDGEREREKKAKEEVNYLPLLSNTSSNSWGVSSSVAAALRAFHLTDVMGDEGSSPSHLKSVTIHLHAGNFRAEGALCGELLEIQIQDH